LPVFFFTLLVSRVIEIVTDIFKFFSCSQLPSLQKFANNLPAKSG